jgi:RNA polymerase sigma-70 factor (ECF subfamily)
MRELVDVLTPVIQARVARALLRRGALRQRDLRQEVEEMTQEVFVSLFDEGGRALRAWSPERGLSLQNFVGLLAEHHVASVLRSGRRNPYVEDPTLDEDLDRDAGPSPAHDRGLESRDFLCALFERLKAELSPKGFQLFQLAIVEERPVPEICAIAGMQPDAVYAWRSRLGKLVRKLAAELGEDGGGVSARAMSEKEASPRIPSSRDERNQERR